MFVFDHEANYLLLINNQFENYTRDLFAELMETFRLGKNPFALLPCNLIITDPCTICNLQFIISGHCPITSLILKEFPEQCK